MLAIYCVDYAARFGDHSDDVMREYARQLINHRINRAGLKRGIERLVRRALENKFTPNPVQFADMCQLTPEDLGLPTLDDAYRDLDQASRHDSRSPKPYQYKHRIIALIAKDVSYEFRLATEEKRQLMLKKAYDKWFEVARTGELPEPIERISRHVELQPVYQPTGGNIKITGPLGAKIERIKKNLSAKKQQNIQSRSACNG